MPSSSHFFQKLGVLQPVSKLLMAVGVVGIIATLLTGQQIILTWSAVSIGLGLALGFFREAFRPKTRHRQPASSGTDEPQPNSRGGITRQLGTMVLLAALAATVVSGLLIHKLGKSPNPGRLLLFGFLSLIAINIVLFCANLLKAVGTMRGAKTEAELGHIMVPALQGEPRQLGVQDSGGFSLACCSLCWVYSGWGSALLDQALHSGVLITIDSKQDWG